MRADVKFGIVLSMVVVFVAGGYYLYRDTQELPIPLTDATLNKRTPLSSPGQSTTAMKKESQQQVNAKTNRRTPAYQPLKNKNRPIKIHPVGNKTSPQIANKNYSTALQPNSLASKINAPGTKQPAPLNGKMRPLKNQNRSLIAKKEIPTVALETHRVQPGDSFASLAKMYYGSERYTQFLMSQNTQIANPNALKIGAVIKIPPAPTSQQAKQSSAVKPGANQSSRKVYVVRSGDSFYRIAQHQLGDANRWEELFNLNKGVVQGDPKRLRPGQKIILP